MAKRKISKTEQKLRAELRADQNRLRKLEKQVNQNWKFGKEGAGKLSLEINARIEAKKEKLSRFGYKGQREINWRSRSEKMKIDETFKFGRAWDKKDAEAEIFKIIKPKSINGKSLKTDLSGAIAEFNKLYTKITSKDSILGQLGIGGDLIIFAYRENDKN